MANNWETTVKITVPKGTNGWQQTGRVRVNGRDYKFPIGVQTQLPKPVAEYVQALIDQDKSIEEAKKRNPFSSPHQVLVTDSDGNPVWEDRTLWTALAAICPEVLTDPDVKILYDPEKTEIAHSEFRDNLDIEVVYFPNVTKINPFAFYGCTNLLAIVFPKLIKLQAGNAFDSCTSLKYLVLPEVTHLSNGCFRHCTSLKALSHKAIAVDAFGECTNLTTITLPEAITVGGFANCTSLNEINLPVAAYYNDYAFMGCTSLTKVYLPNEKNSTIYFNDEIFMNCSNLTALILPGEKVAQCRSVRTGLFTNTPIAEGTGYIYVPAALIESYKTAEPGRYGIGWADYAAQFRAIEDYPEICDPTMDEPITKGEAAALIDSKLECAGGGGSAGGMFVVNMTATEDEMFFTADKTFDEIVTAIASGQHVIFKRDYSGMVEIAHVNFYDSGSIQCFAFNSTDGYMITVISWVMLKVGDVIRQSVNLMPAE